MLLMEEADKVVDSLMRKIEICTANFVSFEKPSMLGAVVSTPLKSGTTLAQQMLYQIMAVTGRVESDPKGELFSDISEVVPFLDARDATGIKCSIHPYEPMCWKSHADASHFPGWDVKFIYGVRNPINATRSFLDFVYDWLLDEPPMSPKILEKVYAKFVERILLNDSERNISDWFTHTVSFLQFDATVLFLVFEDMVKDIGGTVRLLARYLDIEISEEQVEVVVRKCDRKSMANDIRFNDMSISRLMGWRLDGGRRVRAEEDGIFKRVRLDPSVEQKVWEKFERVFGMKSHEDLMAELRRRNTLFIQHA